MVISTHLCPSSCRRPRLWANFVYLRWTEFEVGDLQESARTCRKREGNVFSLHRCASYFGASCGFCTRMGKPYPPPNQSSSMVASGSSRIGIPLRMGYTRLHSLHLSPSSPRITKGFRHTGQASISSRSGLIMAVILARRPGEGECSTRDRCSAPILSAQYLPAAGRRCTRPCGFST